MKIIIFLKCFTLLLKHVCLQRSSCGKIRVEVLPQDDSKLILFSNFDNLKELALFGNDTTLKCTPISINITESNQAYFIPNRPIFLDESLELAKLFDVTQVQLIVFHKVKGITPKIKLIVLSKEPLNINLGLCFSILDFYSNNGTLIIGCSSRNFNNENYFHPSMSIVFRKVIYPRSGLCPLVFKNSQARQISFEDISNSLILRNQLRFSSIDDDLVRPKIMRPLMKFIAILRLDVFYAHLDT